MDITEVNYLDFEGPAVTSGGTAHRFLHLRVKKFVTCGCLATFMDCWRS